MTYKTTWKCRLCGEKFFGEAMFTEKDVNLLTADVLVSAATTHECFGGDMGVADLIGFVGTGNVEQTTV